MESAKEDNWSMKKQYLFHSLDQLAFKDEALALLTMNNSFTFYRSWLVNGANYVQTSYHELRKFKLGPISKINVDLDKDAEHLKIPPRFSIKGDGTEFVETDTDILEVWKKLRSEVRQFMHTILYAIDIISECVSTMEIGKISQRRETAYTSGWGELTFHSGDTSDLKNRCKIHNQDDYIYCRKTMEGEDTAGHDERLNQQLYEGFKEILDSDVQMTPQMCAAVEFSLNHHKPPNA